MLLDQRFLTLHPATAAWWEQRERCESCRWCSLREGNDGEGMMICLAAPQPDEHVRRMLAARRSHAVHLYCIDARDESGPCGPDAKLHQPRTP